MWETAPCSIFFSLLKTEKNKSLKNHLLWLAEASASQSEHVASLLVLTVLAQHFLLVTGVFNCRVLSIGVGATPCRTTKLCLCCINALQWILPKLHFKSSFWKLRKKIQIKKIVQLKEQIQLELKSSLIIKVMTTKYMTYMYFTDKTSLSLKWSQSNPTSAVVTMQDKSVFRKNSLIQFHETFVSFGICDHPKLIMGQ